MESWETKIDDTNEEDQQEKDLFKRKVIGDYV